MVRYTTLLIVVLVTSCAIPDPQDDTTATTEKASLPPDWEQWGQASCHRLCRQIRDYAVALPDDYGWCAPTYWGCYLPCTYDSAHVPAVCWHDFERWTYEEYDEAPSHCAHPTALDPPYSENAEAYRDRYRQCWQLNVRGTR